MKRDRWAEDASLRMTSHMLRSVTRGKDYAPDQTPELSKRGQVGPKSAAIARILQSHADCWAQDGREAMAAGIDFDNEATWKAAMAEADVEIGRYLAGHKFSRGAAV